MASHIITPLQLYNFIHTRFVIYAYIHKQREKERERERKRWGKEEEKGEMKRIEEIGDRKKKENDIQKDAK